MRIIGPPRPGAHNKITATILNMPPTRVHPRFLGEMFGPLWDEAVDYGITPEGVIAQAFHETGGGRFIGKVKPEFRNTAGIKLREDSRNLFPGVTTEDNPLAHAQFATWHIGARAHVQHLCAYAGIVVPGREIVDHRYYLIKDKWCQSFADLGGLGSWAPNPEYGRGIERLATELTGGA